MADVVNQLNYFASFERTESRTITAVRNGTLCTRMPSCHQKVSSKPSFTYPFGYHVVSVLARAPPPGLVVWFVDRGLTAI